MIGEKFTSTNTYFPTFKFYYFSKDAVLDFEPRYIDMVNDSMKRKVYWDNTNKKSKISDK